MKIFMCLSALGAIVAGVAAADDGKQNFHDWHDKYGTGIVPNSVEEAVGNELGPRLLNALYQNSSQLEDRNSAKSRNLTGLGLGTGSDSDVGGCFTCAFTVAKVMPCIYYAVKGGDLNALLKCGIGKSSICDCASCLPDSVYEYVEGWCTSSVGDKTPVTTELVHDRFIDSPDINIKGFLGVLTNDEVKQAERVVSAVAPPPSSPTSDNSLSARQNPLGCVIGASCGGCCCVGLCLMNACVGPCF